MLLAGWEVRIGKNCDRGFENAARGHRPRAALSSGFVYATLSLNWLSPPLQTIRKITKQQRRSEISREYLLDRERKYIKEQIYFELLDVSCIYFTSEVLQKCLFQCEVSCKVWSCTTKTISVSRRESLEIRLFYCKMSGR